MKKLMKSKRGVVISTLLLGIAGLLFGIPIFYTWLKLQFTPAQPVSPIWIAVGAFVVLILLIKRRR